MKSTKEKRSALVLSGAAAKGAFEAGAIAVLTEHWIVPSAIVGTSSGALSGAFYAAAVHAGCEQQAAEELVEFWVDHASWESFLDLSPRDLLAGRGVSRSGRLERLLAGHLGGLKGSAKRDVELRMIATSLSGVVRDGSPTHEQIFRFLGEDLVRQLSEVAHAAVASAALPGLSAPVAVGGAGDCVDGGLVANTPLEEALGVAGIEQVFVVNPSPPRVTNEHFSGVALAARWVEVALGERLHRDLEAVAMRKKQALRLERLCATGFLTHWQQEQVREVLDLSRSELEVVLVEPDEPLPGNLVSAFSDRDLRCAYVERGRVAAQRALGSTR